MLTTCNRYIYLQLRLNYVTFFSLPSFYIYVYRYVNTWSSQIGYNPPPTSVFVLFTISPTLNIQKGSCLTGDYMRICLIITFVHSLSKSFIPYDRVFPKAIVFLLEDRVLLFFSLYLLLLKQLQLIHLLQVDETFCKKQEKNKFLSNNHFFFFFFFHSETDPTKVYSIVIISKMIVYINKKQCIHNQAETKGCDTKQYQLVIW